MFNGIFDSFEYYGAMIYQYRVNGLLHSFIVTEKNGLTVTMQSIEKDLKA